MTLKNKVGTFFLSIIPGVGHLYLGLTKRGLQLLIGTFASIYFIPWFPLIFPFVLAVIWFYSMFDALQKASLINYYIAQQNQDSPHHLEQFDGLVNPIQSMYQDNSMNPLWIGVGFVLAGLIIILRILIPEAFSWLFEKQNSTIILALIMIVFGAGIIFKQKGKSS